MTEFEMERDQAAYKHWGEYKDYELIPHKSIAPEFRDFCYGADWAQARAEKKAKGLVESFKSIINCDYDQDDKLRMKNIAEKALAEYRGETQKERS